MRREETDARGEETDAERDERGQVRRVFELEVLDRARERVLEEVRGEPVRKPDEADDDGAEREDRERNGQHGLALVRLVRVVGAAVVAAEDERIHTRHVERREDRSETEHGEHAPRDGGEHGLGLACVERGGACIAWMTEPAPRKRQALKKACVNTWKKPALKAPTPTPMNMKPSWLTVE
jgi:hypothetical protein